MLARLVTIPEEREPPSDCLAALRDVSARAEMVYAGNGLWWLGVVVDDTPAMREGEGLLQVCRERERSGKDVRVASWRKALLMCQGFRLLASVGAQNGGTDPSPSACADALAPCLFSTRREDELLGDAKEHVTDNTARREASTKMMREELLGYHARNVFRTFRRRSVTVNGTKPRGV